MTASGKPERLVKGSLLVDYVKLIRANKNKNWNQWLQPEDWKIIDSQILPSSWYSFDVWQRLGAAVFSEIAGRNLALIRASGPVMMKGLLSIYKNVLVEGDPIKSIEAFERMRKNFIKGVESDILLIEKDQKRLKIKLQVTEHDRKIGDPEAFANAMAGGIEDLVKRAGGKAAAVAIKETGDGYDLEVKWE